MPSKWRSKPRCDGIMAGERTLAGQKQPLPMDSRASAVPSQTDAYPDLSH